MNSPCEQKEDGDDNVHCYIRAGDLSVVGAHSTIHRYIAATRIGHNGVVVLIATSVRYIKTSNSFIITSTTHGIEPRFASGYEWQH